jgi:WD40 repeat protein
MTPREMAAESERIKKNPNRVDTLSAFQHLITTQKTDLECFAHCDGLVVQQAYNEAPAGSVHEQGKRVLVTSVQPRIVRKWSNSEIYNPLEACVMVLEGHSDVVCSLVISPDTAFAISGSYDKTVRVWDLRSGECTQVLEGHSSWVTSVSISPDASFVVSGSLDKTLRVWDLHSGECVCVLSADSLYSFGWHKNTLVIGTFGGEVQFYELQSLTLGRFITTAFRNSTARPVCCGQLVDVPAAITERIDHWSTHPGEDGYTDSELLMQCPHCQTPLRMNPFFVAPPPL